MSTRRGRSRGFTLLEMALALFIVGFLLVAVPRLATQAQQSVAAAPGSSPAEMAEFSLTGFVLANQRLPCPATTPFSGTENCALAKGFVPYRTLRLPGPVTNAAGFPMAYAVYKGAAGDLTMASAAYTPEYLDSGNSYWTAPSTLASDVVNVLDFCAKLRDASVLAADASLAGVRAVTGNGGVNVAWALVDPGQGNADGAAGAYPEFDGGNRPTAAGWFDSPAKPKSGAYDDTTRVATLLQMFGELRCADRLAAVSAAAREADFANDQWRARKFVLDFRNYDLDVRRQKEVQAYNMKLINIFNVGLTVALSVTDLAIATAGASGAAAIAISVINAVTAISMAKIGLDMANEGYDGAVAEVAEGEDRVDGATSALSEAATFRTERRNALIQADQRGWFQ